MNDCVYAFMNMGVSINSIASSSSSTNRYMNISCVRAGVWEYKCARMLVCVKV